MIPPLSSSVFPPKSPARFTEIYVKFHSLCPLVEYLHVNRMSLLMQPWELFVSGQKACKSDEKQFGLGVECKCHDGGVKVTLRILQQKMSAKDDWQTHSNCHFKCANADARVALTLRNATIIRHQQNQRLRLCQQHHFRERRTEYHCGNGDKVTGVTRFKMKITSDENVDPTWDDPRHMSATG